MNDMLIAALKERDQLKAKLAQEPTFQRLMLVEQVIEAYGGSGVQAQNSPGAVAHPAMSAIQASVAKRGTKTALIISQTAEYLRTTNRRATSGEIAKVLAERGVDVGGAVPAKTLASYLTHSDLFDNVQGEGYGLKEWRRTGSGSQPNFLGAVVRVPPPAE